MNIVCLKFLLKSRFGTLIAVSVFVVQHLFATCMPVCMCTNLDLVFLQ